MRRLIGESSFAARCWFRQLYRQGRRFQHFSDLLKQTAAYSPEELKTYQEEHLKKIIHHCYTNVPYYHELFKQLKLKPEDIRSISDLNKLPYLNKNQVKENFDKLIARNHLKLLSYAGYTSGSTGSPGKFLRDFDAINFENAAVWRHWNQAGDFGKRRITLRGDIVVPTSQTKPPFWKFNQPGNDLMMSSYHLSLETSRLYLEEILAFQPAILYCYPSTAYLLARLFKMYQVNYKFFAIFSSSEYLEPSVREYIEETFQSKVYDWYGQAERVVSIAQCSFGTYHILEDYSITELQESNKPGFSELIGTHLHNKVMPLLRYQTYDQVQPSSKKCPCGSHFRSIESIAGRYYDYLTTPEGYQISITNHIPRGVDNLIETQFYQEKPGEVILRVLTNGNFSKADEEQLIKNTLEHTSPRMKVIIQEVDEIPRGPNGKFISVINKIDPEARFSQQEDAERHEVHC